MSPRSIHGRPTFNFSLRSGEVLKVQLNSGEDVCLHENESGGIKHLRRRSRGVLCERSADLFSFRPCFSFTPMVKIVPQVSTQNLHIGERLGHMACEPLANALTEKEVQIVYERLVAVEIFDRFSDS